MSSLRLRRGIATVSLSGLLADKLTAAAAAGFDGVEIFDNDLIASPLSPAEVAKRCADLGLSVDLFQPVRDVEGVSPRAFATAERRFRAKLAVAAGLGARVVLVCSNVQADAVDDPDLSAAQLARLGDLAAEHDIAIAYEALAWGRHVDRVGRAWDIVQLADHSHVTLAVDTFHMLSRGDGAEALDGVPGGRIGFLQVADAPVLDMNVLEWSRHHRSFPGQGTMDVAAVVEKVVSAGYDGPLSLEVFSDVVREAPAADTARDAIRSLAYLEDEVARRLPDAEPVAPATPRRLDGAFVELSSSASLEDLLGRLGFSIAGWHRHKPVVWWRNGGANVLVNQAARTPALGLRASPATDVARRAAQLGWSSVTVDRAADDTPLPGITSPVGIPVFVSGEGSDDWRSDFAEGPQSPGPSDGWAGIDHVGMGVPEGRLNEEVSFLHALLGLQASPLEEFVDPHGRVRSRAFEPCEGDLRLVVNVLDTTDARREARADGINQIAFACHDLVREVRRLRANGVPLIAVPDNYYDDLAARFDLTPDRVTELRELGILYDRVGDGELLQAFTPVLGQGFYLELLERRHGYRGYGAANAHVRLAAQHL
ncbi:sugar phosphate isomerase/epimerase and 4-hydroxyphenylpyruvate domain-containing protein [Nocardioides panacihumi]|uniref:3-dehydroshikimate dehydratase n=1 Tax=Nocardioides panacihumi TaxID=400774 RepID=A0ABN2QRL6_9ACTN